MRMVAAFSGRAWSEGWRPPGV